MNKQSPEIISEIQKAQGFLDAYRVSKVWYALAMWGSTLAAIIFICICLVPPWWEEDFWHALSFVCVAAFNWLNFALVKEKKAMCSAIVELSKDYAIANSPV
jgi:hypothetical protein